jgi:hypothetical protein
MATRVIDDSKLQDIAVAIQSKDGGGTMTVDEMSTRINSIQTLPPKPDPNGALLLMDWEGTILQSYTHAEAMALESLPDIEDTPYYPLVDHELLEFQTWTETLAYAQDYLRNRPYGQFELKAIYTTTDGQNHNYWRNSELTLSYHIYMQKRGSGIGSYNAFMNYPSLEKINIPNHAITLLSACFRNCRSLRNVNLPSGLKTIQAYSFLECSSLIDINIPSTVSSIGDSAFQGCSSLTKINIPISLSTIEGSLFLNCVCLTKIEIPNNIVSISASGFAYCSELHDIVIHGKPALSNTNALSGAPSDQKIYVHRSDLSWFETETNWSTIYAQGKIVAAADHLEHLISIGIDVTDFENEVISE